MIQIKSMKEDINISNNIPAKKVLTDAIYYIKSSWTKSSDEITELMMELQLDSPVDLPKNCFK